MSIQTVTQYFSTYGVLFVFIIVFLEHLNCPGMPAGIIMPALGIASEKVGINILIVYLVSIIGAVIASYILYSLAYWFGSPILDFICKKFPKMKKPIDKVFFYMEKYGDKGVLITRLIPVGRTIIPFVAGTFKMNILTFTIYSTIGIALWNAALIFSGYLFGNWFI